MAGLEALWSFAGALEKGDLFPVNYERVLCLPTAPLFLVTQFPYVKIDIFSSFNVSPV